MNLHDLPLFLERSWYEKKGLVSAMVLAAGGIAGILLGHLGLSVTLLILLVVEIAIYVAWRISIQPPKTPDKKLGFLISIHCSDDAERQMLNEDFIQPLRGLLRTGTTGQTFHVMVMPPHIASTIDDIDSAQALRIKCGAHFMIYGRVRLREINKQQTHVLDLEGIVTHSTDSENMAATLASEFTELMPRRLHVSKENDLLAFQFTSEWADIVARYVIGIASEISGDLDYAEKLFLDAKERLHGRDTQFPVYKKLKERLPLRLSEISEARARYAFRKWVDTKDAVHLEQTRDYLNRLLPIHYDSHESINLRAIIAFVIDDDVVTAINLLKKIKAQDDALWQLNMAFLLGYQGNLKNAIRHYRLAIGSDIDPDIISQVEDFIVWVIHARPNASHLYYCLGFFNWKIKGDLEQAKKDFSRFISDRAPNKMQKESELASSWISEIQVATNTN